MMFKTHLAFSILLGLLLAAFFKINSWFFAVLVFSAVLPDIDSSKSFLGRKLPIVEFAAYHRGFFHSLWVLLPLLVILLIFSKMAALAFAIGYLSHFFLDMLNFSGITLFYPIGFAIKGWIKTGSPSDWLLFLSFSGLSMVLLIGQLS